MSLRGALALFLFGAGVSLLSFVGCSSEDGRRDQYWGTDAGTHYGPPEAGASDKPAPDATPATDAGDAADALGGGSDVSDGAIDATDDSDGGDGTDGTDTAVAADAESAG